MTAIKGVKDSRVTSELKLHNNPKTLVKSQKFVQQDFAMRKGFGNGATGSSNKQDNSAVIIKDFDKGSLDRVHLKEVNNSNASIKFKDHPSSSLQKKGPVTEKRIKKSDISLVNFKDKKV